MRNYRSNGEARQNVHKIEENAKTWVLFRRCLRQNVHKIAEIVKTWVLFAVWSRQNVHKIAEIVKTWVLFAVWLRQNVHKIAKIVKTWVLFAVWSCEFVPNRDFFHWVQIERITNNQKSIFALQPWQKKVLNLVLKLVIRA